MEIIQNFDFTILDWIQSKLTNPFLDWLMPIITSLGNAGAIWVLIAIIFLMWNKTRKYGFIMVVTLILCMLVGNLGMKPFFARTRPFDINTAIEILISKPKDFSFPSGHTMVSFAGATVLFYMNKYIGVGALILAGLIGFSRLYLYVHFPSDVLVGMIIGVILALVSILASRIIEKRRV